MSLDSRRFLSQSIHQDDSYIVGTSDAEVQRLERQHRLFRPMCDASLAALQLQPGARVLDVGAGPGAASIDLARLVGPTGRVVALERHHGFAEYCRRRALEQGLSQLEVYRADVLEDPLPSGPFDLIWCRWLAVFVADAALLVERLLPLLQPGGTILFLETIDWSTLSLHGASKSAESAISEFAQLIHRSILSTGADPVVARRLPQLLANSGLTLNRLQPLILAGQAEIFSWLYEVIDLMGDQLVDQDLWSPQAREDALQAMREAGQCAGAYAVGPLQIWIQAVSEIR